MSALPRRLRSYLQLQVHSEVGCAHPRVLREVVSNAVKRPEHSHVMTLAVIQSAAHFGRVHSPSTLLMISAVRPPFAVSCSHVYSGTGIVGVLLHAQPNQCSNATEQHLIQFEVIKVLNVQGLVQQHQG